jgi:hypothetical protein
MEILSPKLNCPSCRKKKLVAGKCCVIQENKLHQERWKIKRGQSAAA